MVHIRALWGTTLAGVSLEQALTVIIQVAIFHRWQGSEQVHAMALLWLAVYGSALFTSQLAGFAHKRLSATSKSWIFAALFTVCSPLLLHETTVTIVIILGVFLGCRLALADAQRHMLSGELNREPKNLPKNLHSFAHLTMARALAVIIASLIFGILTTHNSLIWLLLPALILLALDRWFTPDIPIKLHQSKEKLSPTAYKIRATLCALWAGNAAVMSIAGAQLQESGLAKSGFELQIILVVGLVAMITGAASNTKMLSFSYAEQIFVSSCMILPLFLIITSPQTLLLTVILYGLCFGATIARLSTLLNQQISENDPWQWFLFQRLRALFIIITLAIITGASLFGQSVASSIILACSVSALLALTGHLLARRYTQA